MLFQSAAMVAKKLPVDYKILACAKQISLLGVRCKVSDKKTLSCETFCFLVNVCYHNLSSVLQLTDCFL